VSLLTDQAAAASAPRSPVRMLETVDAYGSALDRARAEGRSVGLVPTMGALHRGHWALMERAVAECDVVAVSIFVNPTQFGDPTDLARYPRDLDADLAMVTDAGVEVVFAPSVAEMYPGGADSGSTTVSVAGLSDRYEGASRPGHFDGVATVVVKLLAATGRCRAYFGEKDFQQLCVVRRLVWDLLLPTDVVGCPTVREGDGLALSSRNRRLSPDQRRAAGVLSRALRSGAALIRAGEFDPGAVEARMAEVVAAEDQVALDYAVVVGANDLEPLAGPLPGRDSAAPLRLLIAGVVGGVRLIDNVDPWSMAGGSFSGGGDR
jgi:pantoate--beta-alanine ligase